MSLALGLVAAFLASVLYSLGVTLQSIEARKAPDEEALRTALLWRLLRRPRWIGGNDVRDRRLGTPGRRSALRPDHRRPARARRRLFVLLIAGTRLSDERVERRDVLSVLAITIGVIGLAITAPPQAEGDGSPVAVSVGLVMIGVGALIPLILGRRRRATAAVIALGAGLAYAWVGFSTKFVADALPSEAWVVAAAWLVGTVAAAVIGLISEMTALQRRSATHVFPVVLVVQIVVAVLLAPLLAGANLSTEALAVLATGASLTMVALGAATLAGTRAVGAAISTDR